MRRAIAPAVLLSCAAFAFSQAPGFPDLNVRQSAARAAVERAVRALEAGDAEGAREKLQYEYYYLRNQSLPFDLRIVILTLRSLVALRKAR